MPSHQELLRCTRRDKETYDNKRLWKLRKVMLDALIMAQAQLGDLVRDKTATPDDVKAYNSVKVAIKQAEETY